MGKEGVWQVVKSTLAAMIFSMIFVLIFSLIIKLACLSGTIIKPVNQVFKTLSIALGVLIFVRGERGFLKGAVSGVCSVLLTYVLFGIIGGSFTISWLFAAEIFLGVLAGLISGIIAVNVKKS